MLLKEVKALPRQICHRCVAHRACPDGSRTGQLHGRVHATSLAQGPVPSLYLRPGWARPYASSSPIHRDVSSRHAPTLALTPDVSPPTRLRPSFSSWCVFSRKRVGGERYLRRPFSISPSSISQSFISHFLVDCLPLLLVFHPPLDCLPLVFSIHVPVASRPVDLR